MKKIIAGCLFLLFTAACASTRNDDGPMPPPAPAPSNEASLSDIQTSLTELLERIDVLNARINKLEEQGGAPAASPAAPRPASQPPPAPQPPAARPAQPTDNRQPSTDNAPAQPALKSAQLADDYRNALVLYGKGKPADARRAFQDVFDADPTGELADNALYWIGETYYAAGDYTNAMKYYERVTREFGEQNKAPDALYKIGLTFEKSGDLSLARGAFEDLIRRYPYSQPAASAKLELKRIKY
jgi:tol-pal system protein YbgF